MNQSVKDDTPGFLTTAQLDFMFVCLAMGVVAEAIFCESF